MRRVALLHRYDNELDIREVAARGYSDAYSRATREDFELLIVVATVGSGSSLAIVGEATEGQIEPRGGPPWPGRPGPYNVRVPATNVRETDRESVRDAVEAAGGSWGGQWTIKVTAVETAVLPGFVDDMDLSLAGDAEPPGGFWEGATRRVVVNRYERDPQARLACVALLGARCSVCDFDFEEAYGDRAAGYIHVHHLVPLSQVGASYRINPAHDLRPVCANCHAVIHMRTPPYTIEDVQAMLNRD